MWVPGVQPTRRVSIQSHRVLVEVVYLGQGPSPKGSQAPETSPDSPMWPLWTLGSGSPLLQGRWELTLVSVWLEEVSWVVTVYKNEFPRLGLITTLNLNTAGKECSGELSEDYWPTWPIRLLFFWQSLLFFPGWIVMWAHIWRHFKL